MTAEEMKALLDAALAPVNARLATLEKPAPEAGPSAEARAHTLAVNTKLERFISDGKLPNSPEARAFFVSQCPDGDALAQACAHYEAADKVVSTERSKQVEEPSSGPGAKDISALLTPAQLKICADNKWDPTKIYADLLK